MKFNPKVSLDTLRTVHNVDYFKRSPTRDHLVLVDGRPLYLADVLTNNNSKLGKNILCFDLLAVVTCPNCKDCRIGCYALKAQRQYPATYNKRLINTILAVRHLSVLEQLIVQQLRLTKKKIVRIHSSGDFFNQQYLDMWVRIARQFPRIKFYGYTKTYGIFDFYECDRLENMNIVNSVLPDGSVNFGSADYVAQKLVQFPQARTCKLTFGSNDECMKTCFKCLYNRYILFKEH